MSGIGATSANHVDNKCSPSGSQVSLDNKWPTSELHMSAIWVTRVCQLGEKCLQYCQHESANLTTMVSYLGRNKCPPHVPTFGNICPLTILDRVYHLSNICHLCDVCVHHYGDNGAPHWQKGDTIIEFCQLDDIVQSPYGLYDYFI
jgi:hypothetical protein